MNEEININALADSITRIYYSLCNFSDEFKTEELDKIVYSHDGLVETLMNPNQYKKDIIQIALMLNTPQTDAIDKERKKALEDLLVIANMQVVPMAESLLPKSELLQIVDDVIYFYQQYDPNDFVKNEGWGKEGLTDNFSIMRFIMNNPGPLFSDLHAILTYDTTPEDYVEFAEELIDQLRASLDDPVPDSVRIVFAMPNKDCSFRTIPNNEDGLTAMLHSEELAYKKLGDNLYAAIAKGGKILGLPKCRMLKKINGDKMGIACGNIVFFAVDGKENMVNMTGRQTEAIMGLYGPAQQFRDKGAMPVSNERAHLLLTNLVKLLLASEYGADTLRSAGLTEQEMDAYWKLPFKR